MKLMILHKMSRPVTYKDKNTIIKDLKFNEKVRLTHTEARIFQITLLREVKLHTTWISFVINMSKCLGNWILLSLYVQKKHIQKGEDEFNKIHRTRHKRATHNTLKP
jgi:hypothetical protein